MPVKLTPLAPKGATPPSGERILHNLNNCRKAMGRDNEWKPETVAKWVDFAEAHAEKHPEFVNAAAKMGIEITVKTS